MGERLVQTLSSVPPRCKGGRTPRSTSQGCGKDEVGRDLSRGLRPCTSVVWGRDGRVDMSVCVCVCVCMCVCVCVDFIFIYSLMFITIFCFFLLSYININA